jgi:DNA adenine methylase
MKPAKFIEPFAGGAIVGLTVAFEQLANQVILVERDEQVAAVWRTIISTEGGAEWLANRIVNFELTSESAGALLSSPARSVRENAFQTIVQNRISHGGILAPGAGALKYGENGKGILSRWYPETLRKRILNISRIRKRIRFILGDGFEVIRKNADYVNAVFFIDPPYTASTKKAGTRLYKYYQVDHKELFRLASRIQGDFLMTYDDADEVRALALEHRFETRLVAMSNTHHATMTELLIGRNLDWVR